MNALKDFYTSGRITFIYIVLFPLLLILSCFYIFSLALIRLLYGKNLLKPHRALSCVISVGNITLGGSGKTPLVEYIASKVASDGQKPAILLRGYKRPRGGGSLGTPDYRNLGDEAAMLKQNLSDSALVLAGRNRSGLAREVDNAREKRIIILDDGFQHWRLKRDLDIVVLDARNPFGNRLVLPAGSLREGVSSLKRAHIFCLTHCDETKKENIKKLKDELISINPIASVVETIHAQKELFNFSTGAKKDLSFLRGRKVCVLCGIANPSSFIRAIENSGAMIVKKNIFDDHHDYTQDEIEGLIEACRDSGSQAIVTTEKDAQRLSGSALFKNGVDLLVLRVFLEFISGKKVLDERLSSLYNS